MALPWTMPDPERGAPNGTFDCVTCQRSLGPHTRATMHCGYMEASAWSGKGVPKGVPPHFGGGKPYDVDVCPGWLVRQDAVIEAAEAYTARTRLDRFDPLNLRVVNQSVLAAEQSFNIFEAARQKQLQAKLRAGG